VTKGIYQIRNKIDGKMYIGSAGNTQKRWREHLSLLRRNIHPNIYLQHAWNKYGSGNFEFMVIMEVNDDSSLVMVEQEYLNRMNSYPPNGYNIAHDAIAPMRGMKHTKETRTKISKKNKGRVLSEKTRRKMSDFNKGKILPEEHKRKISKSLMNHIVTKESRENMSKSHIGQVPWMKGKHHTEATRKKISETKIRKNMTLRAISLGRNNASIYMDQQIPII